MARGSPRLTRPPVHRDQADYGADRRGLGEGGYPEATRPGVRSETSCDDRPAHQASGAQNRGDDPQDRAARTWDVTGWRFCPEEIPTDPGRDSGRDPLHRRHEVGTPELERLRTVAEPRSSKVVEELVHFSLSRLFISGLSAQLGCPVDISQLQCHIQ